MLIDSNILIDIASQDPRWSEWSLSRLQSAAGTDSLQINAVIYAEVSVRYEANVDLENFLGSLGVVVESIPNAAAFLAGKAFRRYKQLDGAKSGVLPDFFIGAHAAVCDLPLLTRDARRYRTYFPSIQVIAP